MPAFAFGDVHGHVGPFLARLRAAGLVDGAGRWTGAGAVLWLTGDLADRGPRGAETIALVMRLEREAAAQGGAVNALLGNHDLLLLAVARFGDFRSRSPRRSIRADWLANGGQRRDAEAMGDEQLVWLARRPAVGLQADSLLVHCDSTFYLELGESVDEVNASLAAILSGADTREWADLDDRFWRRNELRDPVAARQFAAVYGCDRVVHGHTPIPVVTGDDPADVREALVYADGACVNVDGGLYMGAPGFLYELGS